MVRRLWPGANLSLDGFGAYKRGPLRGPDAGLAFSFSKADFFNYARTQVAELAHTRYEEFRRTFYDEDPLFQRLSSKPEFTECLRQIRADGGFPVLAHPGHQFKRDPARLRAQWEAYGRQLAAAREAGLWGIELHSYKSAAEPAVLNPLIRELAAAAGLRLTTGSDFHTDAKPYPQLGRVETGFDGWRD